MSAIVLNYSGSAWVSAKVTDSIPTFGQAIERLRAGSPRPQAVSAGSSRPQAVSAGGPPHPRAISAGPQFLSPVSGLVQPPPKPGFIFRIAAAGREKPWTATRPQAFWRTYGELFSYSEPDAGEREAALVRRFGPVNEPETESGELVVYTGGAAQGFFQEIAKAWEPEGADGFSRVSLDRRRRETARHWLSRFVLPAATEIEVTFDLDLRPQLQARSLFTYMAASAASMLQRQALMRRCRYCQLWYEPTRGDSRYCSNSCRVANHVHIRTPPARSHKRKARPHGQHS